MGKHKYKLTVAMATYEDHSGVWSTVQSLRLHHDMEDAEILILDNLPQGEHARENKGFAANANTKHKTVWRKCSEQEPPHVMVVKTKIDDANGCRNEQDLKKCGKLWFVPDGSMYVYYTPTHWSY